uniref:Zona pellucida sperm-binding protein 3 n=1 Tax=Leptobrachium leishanense TaxID=445787 RepID=A0A8C5M0L7_9ANUR
MLVVGGLYKVHGCVGSYCPAVRMGQLIGWSGLLVVLMVFGLGVDFTQSDDSARDRRQAESWWLNSQRPRPEAGWGSSRLNVGVFGQSRQLQTSGQHPIGVQCMEDTMVVTVKTDFYRNGKLVKASDLSLGPRQCRPTSQSTTTVIFQQKLQDCGNTLQCMEDTMVVTVKTDFYRNGKLVKASDLSLGPRQCRPSSQTTTTVIFQQKLQDCGNTLQMTPDWLIYSTSLTYNPTPARNSPVIRTNPAVVLIQCLYFRHQNVSSKAIKPTWSPFSSTISSEERLSLSLRLMHDDWSSPRSSLVFQLGDIFNIEASVDVGNHVPMKVFVDSCVATLSPDPTSSPRYDIIAQYGCLLDGTREDSSSAFKAPRPASNRLQFTVDAFRFSASENSLIYITCNLRATAEDQVPSTTNKACSFSKSTSGWTVVEGTSNICSCCDSGTCTPGSRAGAPFPGHRRVGKREFTDVSPDHESVLLGPLLVLGADQGEGLSEAVTQASGPLELWILVAIISTSVVTVTGLVVTCVMKKRGEK